MARRNYGDAIVATLFMKIPVLCALAADQAAGRVFWATVLVVGPALAIGRTAFLYGVALGWPRWKRWLAALVCGLVELAAWIMYFLLAPSASPDREAPVTPSPGRR